MHLSLLVSTFLVALTVASPFKAAAVNKPYYRSGRYIKDSNNDVVRIAGANWPGHNDAMIPEGLQYDSIAGIVSKIKSLGLNTIRLTFAIEMVDDIESGGDVTIEESFQRALGDQGPAVVEKIFSKNPSLRGKTRAQVFDAVAAECNNQNIAVLVDNHISKATWCCGDSDGNGWFGDTYFNVDNWVRGLSFMANRGKSWPAFIGISLRNELRVVKSGAGLAYGWDQWYKNMLPAATAVHNANPNALIVFSGLDYDTKLGPVVNGQNLTDDGKTFDVDNVPYSNRIVFELHQYDWGTTECQTMKDGLWGNGFSALDVNAKYKIPVILSEWGLDQTEAAYSSVYAQCLKQILPEWDAGWFHWAIGGSYYIRSGEVDYEETWGLLNHDWTDWRNPEVIDSFFKPLVQATTADR